MGCKPEKPRKPGRARPALCPAVSCCIPWAKLVLRPADVKSKMQVIAQKPAPQSDRVVSL